MSAARGVIAVIVCHYADVAVVQRVVSILVGSIDAICLVDNTPLGDGEIERLAARVPSVHYVPMHGNAGLAAGLNRGIGTARALGARRVLLLDQDSVPEAGMVAALVDVASSLEAAGVRVAAVGPRQRDSRTGTLSQPVVFRWFRFARASCEPGQSFVEADFLITSGSLIACHALERIGGMRDEFFIDHIDTEWALRARRQGFKLFVVTQAIMRHAIGETRHRVWFLRTREVALHAPGRYYYIFRNSALLMRDAAADWKWRSAEAMRLVQLFVFLIIHHVQRREAVAQALRGLAHGFRGHRANR